MAELDKFTWRIQPKPNIQNQPSNVMAQLGDGYAQVSPQGLNPNMKSYGNKVSLYNDQDNNRLKDFLEAHGTWKTFLFQCPSRNRLVKVKLTSWTENPHPGASLWDYDINMKEFPA